MFLYEYEKKHLGIQCDDDDESEVMDEDELGPKKGSNYSLVRNEIVLIIL